jgi:hypothetical protein
VADARPDNAYLCNESHYYALRAVEGERDPRAPREVYFVHIPEAAGGDYEALARAVGALVRVLGR